MEMLRHKRCVVVVVVVVAAVFVAVDAVL